MNDSGGVSARAGGQPVGLYVMFITEMWERFSYYGMRALLVLYLVSLQQKGGLGWSEKEASELYGWYTGLVYLTPLIGGYLADRYIGTHRSLLIGGAIIAAGHFSLAFENITSFYLGLLLIIIGTGFFKPNVSTMVGQLYKEGDPRRDAGFTIFYMGINLGALLGALICGYLGESENWGWHYGFGAAGVGMVLGLIVYAFLKPRYLPGIGEFQTPVAKAKHDAVEHAPLTKAERDQILALMITAFFVIFFWLAFEQAGSSMNMFALNRTSRELFGMTIPASWFQSVNPAIILLGGPVMAWLWLWLGRQGREPSTPVKMALGLFFLGLGFVSMVMGALASEGGQLASPAYLLIAYFLHTIGELCLSPVGLSLVTKLAPLKYASLLMGIWFLSNFTANLLGGYLAGSIEAIGRGEYFHILGGQADFFLLFVITSFGASLVFFLLRPWLKKLMHGKA